ncbi:MAG: hypothetical protein QM774_05625 [Gordonia sp. (in: high G+C Gram-positive bacteria)]|uniref:hypothetical protein n=1 Tax=Gordonia sp. (in: high G+C Gram-positive bacteria) TaxID=84139 RepID=UPI0039E4DA74
MTTLNPFRTPVRAATATVDVFGVPWPVYKLHALAAGVVFAAVLTLAGVPGELTVWISGAAAIAVWWGERVATARRWDDGHRDFHSAD